MCAFPARWPVSSSRSVKGKLAQSVWRECITHLRENKVTREEQVHQQHRSPLQGERFKRNNRAATPLISLLPFVVLGRPVYFSLWSVIYNACNTSQMSQICDWVCFLVWLFKGNCRPPGSVWIFWSLLRKALITALIITQEHGSVFASCFQPSTNILWWSTESKSPSTACFPDYISTTNEAIGNN